MPYLNSEPFYFGLDRERFEFVDLVPSAMTRAAEMGEIDAGPLPLVAYFRMEEQLATLGDFCIAAVGQVQSILLFSKMPFRKLANARIGITGETTTSVRLLQVLLDRKYGLTGVRYTGLDDECDAFLLIGDNALRQRDGKLGFPYCYDLGEEWYQWTGLPFVFALWVVRCELSTDVQQLLCREIGLCLERGVKNLEVIAENRVDLGLTQGEVIDYLQGFHYKTGPDERRAIEHFRGLLNVN